VGKSAAGRSSARTSPKKRAAAAAVATNKASTKPKPQAGGSSPGGATKRQQATAGKGCVGGSKGKGTVAPAARSPIATRRGPMKRTAAASQGPSPKRRAPATVASPVKQLFSRFEQLNMNAKGKVAVGARNQKGRV
jgi:hypothetical protein